MTRYSGQPMEPNSTGVAEARRGPSIDGADGVNTPTHGDPALGPVSSGRKRRRSASSPTGKDDRQPPRKRSSIVQIKPLLPGDGTDQASTNISKSSHVTSEPGPDRSPSNVLASKSNYRVLVEGAAAELGISYAKGLTSLLESKKNVHSDAERARRIRMKAALQKLADLLPRGEIFCAGTAHHRGDD